jgi:hypothetical protein
VDADGAVWKLVPLHNEPKWKEERPREAMIMSFPRSFLFSKWPWCEDGWLNDAASACLCVAGAKRRPASSAFLLLRKVADQDDWPGALDYQHDTQ